MSLNNQSLTTGFIDLATFDEIEKYLYGGLEATTYFVREVRKSTWFTVVPTVLTRAGGQPSFDSQVYFQISRAGDYLLNTWFRANISAAAIANPNNNNAEIRWTHNFAHNLVRECTITFNDLVAARLDNFFLDFWAAFTTPAGKQNGYNNMIGNTSALTTGAKNLPAFTINLPLPLFYTRDSGVSLPTAALPYNDMRINLQLRKWEELLVFYPAGAAAPRAATSADLSTVPTLSDGNLWANYAIVSNDERKRMGCAPRDILIEQVQTAPQTTYKLEQISGTQIDIRFSHSVKALFFAARNITVSSEGSNYRVGNLDSSGKIGTAGDIDPISNATLFYENTQRLASLPSDFYSLVEPYWKGQSTNIPYETGYHLYSYSLDLTANDPMGSTNYGKLTNVSLVALPPNPSIASEAEAAGNSYQLIVVALNHNVIRISGGALGFPVL